MSNRTSEIEALLSNAMMLVRKEYPELTEDEVRRRAIERLRFIWAALGNIPNRTAIQTDECFFLTHLGSLVNKRLQ